MPSYSITPHYEPSTSQIFLSCTHKDLDGKVISIDPLQTLQDLLLHSVGVGLVRVLILCVGKNFFGVMKVLEK